MEFQFTYGLTDSQTREMQISPARRRAASKRILSRDTNQGERGREGGEGEVGRNNSSDELFPLARRPLTRIDRVSRSSFRRSNPDRASP